MFAYLSRRGTHLHTAVRPGRIIAALAAVTGGLLGWAAAVPAASAATIPVPDPGGAYGPAPVPAGSTAQVITAGMPGWQIILIAVAAALVAATAAVFLDRARASRQSASATR
jgi:hypothetical protein